MTDTNALTAQIADFVVQANYESLPEEVVAAAKQAIVDTIGVTVAGRNEDSSRIAIEYARSAGAADESSVLGSDLKTTAAMAALVNGTMGHALDFDDVSASYTGHPSVTLTAPMLALAERQGKSGKAALLAFVVGFEVQCKIGRAMGASSYARGWHATSIMGTLGAAAVSAKLLDLDEATTRNALGIAVSMASGSRQNFGTMTKPLHAGLAARNGVDAAMLASLGFTADETAVESPLGFGALFSPAGDWRPERVTDFGEPWDVVDPGTCVKKYPCCYMTHRALDATLLARGDSHLTEAEIERIEVGVEEGSTSALIHSRPQTGLEAKFSMEYCTSAAVLDGAVTLASFEDESVLRPEAQSLLRRVSLNYVPRVSKSSEVGGEVPATVRIHLKNGEVLDGSILHERGSAENPLGWDDIASKYMSCTTPVIGDDAARASLSLLSEMEKLTDFRELLRWLQKD